MEEGENFQKTNRTDTALGYYVIIVSKYNPMIDTHDKKICVRACVLMGLLYYEKGLYSKAFDTYMKGIRICEDNGFYNLLPELYKNIGNIYGVFNDFAAGIENQEKALRLVEKYPEGNDEVKVKLLIRLTVGDEGNTFIAANSFPAEDLEIYRDKYITSVRTVISHNFELGTKDTHASIIIFEDNEIVREQEIKDLEYNEFMVIPLDEPLPINTDKELKVGIKIFDYDPQQIPIVYQNTDEYVKGRSDLYSQDGGKTWLCLSDFFATMEGHEKDGFACWEITANITDEPTAETLEQDENLETYNVYRNGERLNDTFIYNQQTRFTDEAPVDNATYTVIAFYTDGSFSAVSNEFKVGVISVESVYNNENQISVYPNPASDFVCVEGEFSRASLLDISGKLIFTTESDMRLSQNYF